MTARSGVNESDDTARVDTDGLLIAAWICAIGAAGALGGWALTYIVPWLKAHFGI